MNISIEYVGADLSNEDPALLEQFKGIFDRFARPEDLFEEVSENNEEENEVKKEEESSSTAIVESEQEPKKLSKKKKKLLGRLSVAQLKQLVPRPDVVEAHDITSHDPRLLVFLKAYRNTVPVPRHWCHKRKYLAGKRGIERPPFQLPEFIAETGIAKIRESVLEAESAKKSSQKARDKMTPKMGRIDIDYQVLHDAFFKYQTKPKMTIHGDIYYEGKEYEIDLKEKKPGILSPALVEALGMQPNYPPPWLINMQRYGPPPSYPNLRIPGLNAPLPPGCEYGYQPGQWGKPPVDEYGRPIYGDVFGLLRSTHDDAPEIIIDKDTKWGEINVAEAADDDQGVDESDEEEEGVQQQQRGGGKRGGGKGSEDIMSGTISSMSGLETPNTMDGISSISTGLETPDGTFDLRKRTAAAGMETPEIGNYTIVNRELYHVIQEKQNTGAGGSLFASDKTYVLPGSSGSSHGSNNNEDVEVSVNPDQLEDTDQLKNIYEEQHQQHQDRADDSGAADDSAAGGGKRKRKAETASAAAKRVKEFKF